MDRMAALEGFRSMVRRYPDGEAIVTPDGQSVTYRDLDRRSDALAAALETRIPGQRCAVLTLNRIEVIVGMLAAMKRGMANVQLATRGAPGELASMISTSDAMGLLYGQGTADTAEDVLEQVDLDLSICFDAVAGVETYAELLDTSEPDSLEIDRTHDESAIFFTSGTTGESKAIVVDQEQAWAAAMQPALEMSLTVDDRAIVITPWYHMVTTEAWVLPHILVGATLVLEPDFDPERTLRRIDDEEVTGLLAVPTQLDALLEAQESVDAGLDTLDYIRTGGAIVSESLIERVRERFTEGVFNTYGLTEGVGNLTFAYPDEQHDHPGTIGKASYLWEVRVVEAADPPAKPDPAAVVDTGEVGEVIGKSFQMTDGYIGRPEETEALFVDGWLRTGDIARLDQDGFPVIIDRVDNMIISGGENVYPEEVQRALEGHPAVREAGVVGLQDDRWGEVVAAAVVAHDVTEQELDEYCQELDTLADFKRPRKYRFVETLPRSATGTLVRGEIEEFFKA